MRTTRYGEPSDREIDALRIPPRCPLCGADVDEYDELCTDCREPEGENNTTPFKKASNL